MKIATFLMLFLVNCGVSAAGATEVISDDTGWGDHEQNIGGIVSVVEDKQRNVVCYVYNGYKAGGIFCLTKKQLCKEFGNKAKIVQRKWTLQEQREVR